MSTSEKNPNEKGMRNSLKAKDSDFRQKKKY